MFIKTNERGVSTIEIVIGLAIMALLYSLYVTIIGPLLQDASQMRSSMKICNDFQDIYNAGQYYLTKQGNLLTSDASGTWRTEIRTAGVLTSIPVLRSEIGWDGSYPIDNYAYALDGSTYTGWGDPAQTDTSIVLQGVSDLVCKEINKKFSNNTTYITIPATINYTIDLQCFKSGTTNIVARPLYLDQIKTN